MNRQRALNTIGEWVLRADSGEGTQFDHVGTGVQFFTGEAEFVSIRALSNAPVHPTLEDVQWIRYTYNSTFTQ